MAWTRSVQQTFVSSDDHLRFWIWPNAGIFWMGVAVASVDDRGNEANESYQAPLNAALLQAGYTQTQINSFLSVIRTVYMQGVMARGFSSGSVTYGTSHGVSTVAGG